MFRKFRDAMRPSAHPSASPNAAVDDEATEFEIGEEDWSLPLFDPTLRDLLGNNPAGSPVLSDTTGGPVGAGSGAKLHLGTAGSPGDETSMMDALSTGSRVVASSGDAETVSTASTAAAPAREDGREEGARAAGMRTTEAPEQERQESSSAPFIFESPTKDRTQEAAVKLSDHFVWNCERPVVPPHCFVGVGVVIFDEVEGPVVDWFYAGGGTKLDYDRNENGKASAPTATGAAASSVRFPVLSPDVRRFSAAGRAPATSKATPPSAGATTAATAPDTVTNTVADNNAATAAATAPSPQQQEFAFHEDLQPYLAFLTIPDGGHAVREDSFSTTYFLLPTSSKSASGGTGSTSTTVLYGVSLYGWQLCASAKRGYRQSALVLLAQAPFFGHLRKRLLPIARICLLGEAEHVRDILKEWYDYIRKGVTPHALAVAAAAAASGEEGATGEPAKSSTVPNTGGAVVTGSKSVTAVRERFLLPSLCDAELTDSLSDALLFLLKSLKKGSLMAILKAILLERRVVVYSPSSEVCSAVVLALCSLLPGCSWFGFLSYAFGRQFYNFEKSALPLRVFHDECPVYPYLSLQLLDSLASCRGFLVGTSNRLLVYNAESACAKGRGGTSSPVTAGQTEMLRAAVTAGTRGDEEDVFTADEVCSPTKSRLSSSPPGEGPVRAASFTPPTRGAKASERPTTTVPDLVIMLPGGIGGANASTHLRWTRPDVEQMCEPTAAEVKFQAELLKLVKHLEPGNLVSQEERSCGVRTPFTSPKRKKRVSQKIASSIKSRASASSGKKSSLEDKALAGVIVPKSVQVANDDRESTDGDNDDGTPASKAHVVGGHVVGGQMPENPPAQQPDVVLLNAERKKIVDKSLILLEQDFRRRTPPTDEVAEQLKQNAALSPPPAVQQFSMDDDSDAPIEVDTTEFRNVSLPKQAAASSSATGGSGAWGKRKADAMVWYKQKTREASASKKKLLSKVLRAPREDGASISGRKLDFSKEEGGERTVENPRDGAEFDDDDDEPMIAAPGAKSFFDTSSSSTSSGQESDTEGEKRNSGKPGSDPENAADAAGVEEGETATSNVSSKSGSPLEGFYGQWFAEKIEALLNPEANILPGDLQGRQPGLEGGMAAAGAPEQALARIDLVRRAIWNRFETFLRKVAFFGGEQRNFDRYFLFSGSFRGAGGSKTSLSGEGGTSTQPRGREAFKSSALVDALLQGVGGGKLLPVVEAVAPNMSVPSSIPEAAASSGMPTTTGTADRPSQAPEGALELGDTSSLASLPLSRAQKVAKSCRTELTPFGLSFALYWATATRSGRRFLRTHNLDVNPLQKRRPPVFGFGVYSFRQSGDVYQGQFHQSKRHGVGVYSSPQHGLRYDGQWLADRRHGQGIMTIASEKGEQMFCYDGAWVDDCREGFGRCISLTEKYSGNWRKNKYDGHGSYVSGDGRLLYDGDFSSGKFHGTGKLRAVAGEKNSESAGHPARSEKGHAKLHVNFDAVVMNAFGGTDQGLGFHYIGEFRDGKRHGEGQMKIDVLDRTAPWTSLMYVGAWARDQRHGTGRILAAAEQAATPPSSTAADTDEASAAEAAPPDLRGAWEFDGNFNAGRKQGRGTIHLRAAAGDSIRVTADWHADSFLCRNVTVEVVGVRESVVYEGGVEVAESPLGSGDPAPGVSAAVAPTGAKTPSAGSVSLPDSVLLQPLRSRSEDRTGEKFGELKADVLFSDGGRLSVPLSFGGLWLRAHGGGRLMQKETTSRESDKGSTAVIEGIFEHGTLLQ